MSDLVAVLARLETCAEAGRLLPEEQRLLFAVAKAAAELRWLQAQPITATQALHKAGPALDAALSALAKRGME